MVVLLSDHDIRLELDAGRLGLDPYDAAMVQPSSVDVRLDRYFRLFDNHKYPFIDPAFTASGELLTSTRRKVRRAV